MATIFTILLLVLFGIVAALSGIYALNLGGLPGVLISGLFGNRFKFLFKIGFIIIIIGQTYISLAYNAFIISWTMFKINTEHVSKYGVWVIAFLAVVLPVWENFTMATDEKVKLRFLNPQVDALYYTVLTTTIGFLIFLFIPDTMELLWDWVPFVGKY